MPKTTLHLHHAIIMVSAAALLAPAAKAQTTVRASDFGFDAHDSTAILQRALDSDASVVVIDNRGADWVTRPLFINRDNLKIVFEPGVTVAAKPGGFPRGSDSLITARRRSNLVFSGYGAVLRMQNAEYPGGEWRMVLNLLGCSHVLIEGLILRDSGGDGIYLGSGGNSQPYCLDIHVRDVTCTNNRRQGISVISAQDLLIEDSALSNTNGTEPQTGIDFEPNHPSDRLVNCVVRNTSFENNHGPCIGLGMMHMSSTSEPLGIRFENINCLGGGASQGISFSGEEPPSGTVEFRDVLVSGFKDQAVSGFSKPAYAAALYRFTRLIVRDIGGVPLYLSGTARPTGDFGGVEWKDVVVQSGRKGPFLTTATLDTSPGVANVRGNITVFDPNGATMDLGAKAHDVDVRATGRRNVPDTTVSISADGLTFTATRTSDALDFPLAVTYEVAGNAVNRLDYAGLPGLIVIPPGAKAASVTVTPHPALRCGGRALTISLTAGSFYRLSGASQLKIELPETKCGVPPGR